MAAPIAILVAVSGFIAALRHWLGRRRLPDHAVTVSPRKSTVIAQHGAVRSVQSAELTVDAAELERVWTPANLENLAGTYWRFLSTVTLGLIRVVYGTDSRSVVLLIRPFTLLRFAAPEYVLEPEHGAVRWRILDGLLVARSGRGSGYLALDVRREPTCPDGREKLLIEVEVANFYPAIAAGFSLPVYEMTQSAIHVLVTNAFLRSLAKRGLAESRVGQLSDQL